METTATQGVIMFHPKLLEHDPLSASPEGSRLAMIIERLTLDGLWNDGIYEADIAPMKRLREIHEAEYLNVLHKKSVYGADQLDEDTPIMGKSFEIARFGAGGVLDAVDLIMSQKAKRAFCLTSMPGHHAGISKFRRGSLINPVAAGAHYAVKKYALKRVMILDIDAEHGIGTQEIFWKRREILNISLHEYPGTLGTGHYSEVGEKASQGYNLNFPLPSGYGDREYRVCFQEIIEPVINQFKPEFIFLAFGTNLLASDPSSHLIVSEYGLIAMVATIMEWARKYADDRIISVLEGGTAGSLMARAVSQHVMLLLNNRWANVDKVKKEELISYSDWFRYSKLLKAQMKKFWRL